MVFLEIMRCVDTMLGISLLIFSLFLITKKGHYFDLPYSFLIILINLEKSSILTAAPQALA